MENIMIKERRVLSSDCDAEGKLGIRNIFDIFMDLAAEHAERLGVGYYSMLGKNCYWVAVRTRVKLYDRPPLGSCLTAMTWPGKPGLAKSDRFYRLESEGSVLAEGRTEWAAQDIETGAVRRSDSYGYPVDLQHREERVCAEPFNRFRGLELRPEELVRRYTVGSMDIDMGRHMNNVAYIRMLLDVMSTKELEEMDISEVEISYRRACFEGEVLDIYRTERDNAVYFQVVKPDGETAVQAVMKGGKETED